MIRPRILAQAVADATGISLRVVQRMAKQGQIPGAARLGRCWTFDPDKVQAWIDAEEQAVCPTTSTSAANSGGSAAPSVVVNIDEAYARAIAL